jgi:purine-cytosine permease-like protein
MTIKKAYFYFFYKIYKFLEAFEQTRWLSELKAGCILVVLEILFLISLKVYYSVFFNPNDEFIFYSLQTLLPFSAVVLINYFCFAYDDKWKAYADEFSRWSPEVNLKGTWIVILIVLFILFNLVFSFYLLGVQFKRW